MLQSLLMKAAMLAATVALILWIGWPTQQDSLFDLPRPASRASVESNPDQAVAPKSVSAATVVTRSTESQPVFRKPKLDINLATAQELQALPGIGEVLAKRVVEWRGTHGSFRTVEDLANVKGIGPKRMEQLRPLLMAGLSSAPLQKTPSAAASREGKGL